MFSEYHILYLFNSGVIHKEGKRRKTELSVKTIERGWVLSIIIFITEKCYQFSYICD